MTIQRVSAVSRGALIAVLTFAAAPVIHGQALLPSDHPTVLRRSPEAIPGEYLVRFNDELVSAEAVDETAREMVGNIGGRFIGSFQNGARGFAVAVSEEAILRLLTDPRVSVIEENARGHASYSVEYYTNDDRWNLDRIDQRATIAANTTDAFGWTYTGDGVDVYVVDTGILSSHQEFATGQVTAGADYAGGDGHSPTNPCGGYNSLNGGHGTSVASVIGGQTVGQARDARLIPVKVFECDPNAYQNDISLDLIGGVWALDWILGQVQSTGRESVVNMSFFYTTSDQCVDAQGVVHNCASSLEYNINDLLNANVVVVASANNQSQDRCTTQSPARMGYGGMHDTGSSSQKLVITVGGTDINDQLYATSGCSGGNGSNVGECVSIYAPAESVLVASLSGYRDNTDVCESSGTSFAAPLVAGAAARLLEQHPTWNPREVWDQLIGSATSLSSNFDGDGVAANDKLLYMSVYD